MTSLQKARILVSTGLLVCVCSLGFIAMSAAQAKDGAKGSRWDQSALILTNKSGYGCEQADCNTTPKPASKTQPSGLFTTHAIVSPETATTFLVRTKIASASN